MKKEQLSKYSIENGVSIASIRKLVKIGLDKFIYLKDFKSVFQTTTNINTKKKIRDLESHGYIERYKDLEVWVNTAKGNILANSKFKRPIKREKANAIIEEVFNRVNIVNTNDEYLFFIDELYIAGDFLDESINEIDKLEIAIQIKSKFDSKTQEKLVNEKRDKSERYFPTIFDRLDYPQSEIKPFIKSSVHNLNVYNYYVFKTFKVPSKLIYKRQFE